MDFRIAIYRQTLTSIVIAMLSSMLAFGQNNVPNLIERGDEQFYGNNYERAIEYYKQALKGNVENKALHQRIVSVYESKVFTTDEIFSYCSTLSKMHYYDIGANSIEAFMHTRKYDAEERNSEKAIVWWLDYKNRLSDISMNAMRRIPPEWRSASERLNQLEELLVASHEDVNLDSWTSSREVYLGDGLKLNPTFVIGNTLAILGNQHHQSGDIAFAIRYYKRAYNIICKDDPHSFLSDPDEVPDIFFKVAGRLGILYALDKDTQEEFRQLESDLFDGKGVAYFRLKRDVIQKFHSTLGLIYASIGQWEGDRYRNARFQLENAIQKAPKGANLGYLQKTLAEGYQNKLNDESNAAKYYIESSKSFLNNDNLQYASKLTKNASLMRGHDEDEIQKVNAIINLRKDIPTLTSGELENRNELENRIKETFSKTNSRDDFVVLQKFKIYADIAEQASKQDLNQDKLYYHNRSLLEIQKTDVLNSNSDIIRIQQAQESLYESLKISGRVNDDYQIHKDFSDEDKPDNKTWELYQQGNVPTKVVIKEEFFDGVKFVDKMEKKDISPNRISDAQLEQELDKKNLKNMRDEMKIKQ